MGTYYDTVLQRACASDSSRMDRWRLACWLSENRPELWNGAGFRINSLIGLYPVYSSPDSNGPENVIDWEVK